MDNMNYVFFEEYKHLEKLCREMYDSYEGVTSYIDDMKKVSFRDYSNIPNWRTDLEQLCRLRHIRNNLAHTEGAFYEQNCTQEDVDWVKDFYRRIMAQSDPLSVLRQNSMINNLAPKQNYNVQNQTFAQGFYVQNQTPNQEFYMPNKTSNQEFYMPYKTPNQEFNKPKEPKKKHNSSIGDILSVLIVIVAVIFVLMVIAYLLMEPFLI